VLGGGGGVKESPMQLRQQIECTGLRKPQTCIPSGTCGAALESEEDIVVGFKTIQK
jgi:hypothetical protein